jgi:hypothetical protein
MATAKKCLVQPSGVIFHRAPTVCFPQVAACTTNCACADQKAFAMPSRRFRRSRCAHCPASVPTFPRSLIATDVFYHGLCDGGRSRQGLPAQTIRSTTRQKASCSWHGARDHPHPSPRERLSRRLLRMNLHQNWRDGSGAEEWRLHCQSARNENQPLG